VIGKCDASLAASRRRRRAARGLDRRLERRVKALRKSRPIVPANLDAPEAGNQAPSPELLREHPRLQAQRLILLPRPKRERSRVAISRSRTVFDTPRA
jgi:hypothetical protein